MYITSHPILNDFVIETVVCVKKKLIFEKFQDNSTSTKASALDTH